jgi:hypothetical protein
MLARATSSVIVDRRMKLRERDVLGVPIIQSYFIIQGKNQAIQLDP